jgi:uncharacterized membrane protein (DUF106 family)
VSWYDDWFVQIIQTLNFHKPPLAMIFLVLVAVGVTFFSIGMSKLLVNMKEIERLSYIKIQHDKERDEAIRDNDGKKWIRVKYRESYIQQVQRDMMMKRMVPQFVIIIPFILIFTTLRGAMGIFELNATPDRGGILAVLPFKVHSWYPIIGGWFSELSVDNALSVAGFGSIYFLTAIFTTMLLTKVIGINPKASGLSPGR